MGQRLPKNYSKVTSFVQAEFHLNNGEVLVSPVSIFKSLFIRKHFEEDDLYEVVLIPMIGKSTAWGCKREAVRIITEEFSFFVLKGSVLKVMEQGSMSKAVTKFCSLFRKRDKDA